MKRMKSSITLPLFLCLLGMGMTASAATVPEGVGLYIRLYDKEIYTPESPVTLHVGIVNTTDTPFVFHVADDKIFSLQLTVTDLHNEVLSPTREYISRRNSNQQVLYREIRLLPGEEYAFRTTLSSFVDISGPGVYFVRAALHPFMDGPGHIDSNEITLHIRPAGQDAEAAAVTGDERIEDAERELLRRQNLSPDDVVRYMIDARIAGDWRKYFLYLDVESLMLAHRLKRERYARSSEEERRRMIEKYKELLRSSMVNSELLMRPSAYDVVQYRVNLNNREDAEVTVLSRFSYPEYTEIKRFIYYLHRPDQYWQIHDYDVINEGTE
jgi:hypothetical protein